MIYQEELYMHKPTFDNTIVLLNHNAINLQMFQNEYDQPLKTVKNLPEQ